MRVAEAKIIEKAEPEPVGSVTTVGQVLPKSVEMKNLTARAEGDDLGLRGTGSVKWRPHQWCRHDARCR